MKICFCNQDMSIGGSSTVVYEIIKNWSDKSDQLFLILFFDNFSSKYESLNYIKNLKIIFLHKKRTIDFPFLKNLKKTMKNIKPDVISSHLTCVFYLKFVGVHKYSIIYHTIHSLPSKDLPKIYRIYIKNTIKSNKIRLIGCCDYIANEATKLYKTHCISITNGVHISNYVDKKVNKKTVFLYIGRFDKMKNIDIVIKAFKEANNNNSILRICGYGAEEKNIKAMIANDCRIEFLGKVSDVKPVYSSSDVICILSEWEGMPMTILEGINYGNAFICRNVGGISQFVEDGQNGFLLDDISTKTVSEKINLLSNNIELLKTMQSSSLKMKNLVDSKTMSKNYENRFKVQ